MVIASNTVYAQSNSVLDVNFTNGYTVEYDEPDALDKINNQIKHYIEESEY